MTDLNELLANYFWLEDLEVKEDVDGIHLSYISESEQETKESAEFIADNLDMNIGDVDFNDGKAEIRLERKR